MARLNTLILGGALLALVACTPGGTAVPTGGGAGMTIDIDLTTHAPADTPQGRAAGYAPLVTTVAVGTTIQFKNSDTFLHTASFVGTQPSFPDVPHFNGSETSHFGTAISQPWSTGALSPGTTSPSITIDVAGTYLYGCFYHYSAPMRGVIVAQ
ncbi:MAG: hypothetical protein JO165_08625 [Candidatus Eremiobacteraeota bacterium]|nr:hypothetical protein [Candidatus Eremiobacteraeota bacterium]